MIQSKYLMSAASGVILQLALPITAHAQEGDPQPAPAYAAEASPRFALLIGNADYNLNGQFDDTASDDGSLTDLKNSCEDVQLIAEKLIRLGWNDDDVVVKCDLKKPEVDHAVDEFAERFASAVAPTAILYFAGHGVQINDRNYVFGAGGKPNPDRAAATLSANPRAKPFAKDAEEITQYVSQNIGEITDGALLVVLDACRENPLIPKLKNNPNVRSLSGPRPFTPPFGIMTAYSTSNGELADDGAGANSPFAKALYDRMRPGATIETILNEAATEVYDKTVNLPKPQQPSKLGNFRQPPTRCLTDCDVRDASLLRPRIELAMAGELDLRGLMTLVQAAPPVASQAEIDAAKAQFKPVTGKEQLRQPVRTVYERLTNAPDEDARPKMFVDVFWCDGDDLAEVRRVRASELAASLATYGRYNSSDMPTVLQRVRVRQLTADVNVTTNYLIKGDVIRANEDNLDEQKWAERIKDVALSPLSLESQKRGAENSIGVYMCSDVRIDARPSRVYFQIASIEQQGGTTNAIRQLKKDVPGLSIAVGLDLQEKNSPDSSEVRYFYKEDERTAALVAQRLFEITGQPVSAKRLEGKVIPGTLEVWMGKTANLARVSGQ